MKRIKQLNSKLAWVVTTALILAVMPSTAAAVPPWLKILPFQKSVEADPAKDYKLQDTNGPWMILAANFAGDRGEEQAKALVLELRREHGMEAYVYRREFDYTEPQEGMGFDRYGNPAKFRHAYSTKYEGIAVLVGNFESVDDAKLEDTLEKIKHMRPDCLELKEGESSGQRFAVWRALQQRIARDPEKRSLGPMGAAFASSNPLLPEEFFQRSGLDPLVIKMNEAVEHSLLDNPGNYTVRVATFRGTTITGGREIEDRLNKGNVKSQLEQAAIKAHNLTEALRKRGVEAYEFHDRYESVVTVGSFASLGNKQPNGTLDLAPAVHKIMENFSASKQPIAGRVAGLVPRQVDGIALDIQAVPVEVPKVSPLAQRNESWR